MKPLLFDQNLSPRLIRTLADIYLDAVHVARLGLDSADDKDVSGRMPDYMTTSSLRKMPILANSVWSGDFLPRSFGFGEAIAQQMILSRS